MRNVSRLCNVICDLGFLLVVSEDKDGLMNMEVRSNIRWINLCCYSSIKRLAREDTVFEPYGGDVWII